MKIIHAAFSDKGLLLLKEASTHEYTWFLQDTATEITASSIEEAIRLAWRVFPSFTPLNCGFKFVLPERDEHGNNALFADMIASLKSMNGIYFDDKLGHNCIVHNIPSKSRELALKIIQEEK